jgi:hypothetical protein
MTTNDVSWDRRLPSRQVLAWWDVDVDIGAFRKRKLTARPLKELERFLGHRVHVEGRWRYEKLPPNVWKFEAFNYLDTADPALAAFITLKQLIPISDWCSTSWQGFNATADPTSDDLDDGTICAFYWAPPDQRGMPRYISSGVLLMLVDANRFQKLDRREHLNRLARPVVQPHTAPAPLADYLVEFTAYIICNDKRDLMEFHLPRFQASHWPQGVDDLQIDAVSHAGKPNIIRVRQTLRDLREHEAVAHCLSFARSLRIKLELAPNFRLVGEFWQGREYSDGIASFVMTRI